MALNQSNSMMPFTDSEAAAFGSPGAAEQREQESASVPMPSQSFPDGQRSGELESAVGTSGVNTHPRPMDDLGPEMHWGNGGNAKVAPMPDYSGYVAGEVSSGVTAC